MTEEDPRVLQLREMRATAMLGGGKDKIERQHAKGKMTARERLEILLDKGSFNELEPFVTARPGTGIEKVEALPGDGVVTGFGRIDGRPVYVYAQDFTVQGGALGEMQSHKICRVMDLAAENGAPIIGLIDSGGARIQEGVRSLRGYGDIFRRNSLYSGIIPQISIVMGPCAGGAAYSPALTDLIIMVEKQSYMFLTGPDVIKSVTGEIVDSEVLGGADTHLSISGLAHLTTPDERSALDMCRRVLGYLPSNHLENSPTGRMEDPARLSPELNSFIPLDASEPYVMHTIIEKIVDGGSFLELQASFARNVIVGLARMGGEVVGIIAQEPSMMAGVVDIDAADKMCRFVRWCDCFNIPLVTLVDSPGFLPGVDQEHRGIIRHGAKVLYAYSEATVPMVSVITRKAYGGAYIVMSSKFLGTDVTFAWPSAEIAVMGPEGAVNILYRRQVDAAEDPAAERKRLTQEYREKYLNPYAAAALGAIDEVIEPQETRRKIIAALQSLRSKAASHPVRRHGNIPV
ncbi:MAG: acyl-CoA carboxylase subunit beta [Leptolinea sp.]|jgi:propionyl-CoA carboxylase beta chain|nr:acyl-CoA carboxylase subunit beta [Leptolinea sp.]